MEAASDYGQVSSKGWLGFSLQEKWRMSTPGKRTMSCESRHADKSQGALMGDLELSPFSRVRGDKFCMENILRLELWSWNVWV